jgi:hypothetical protein
MRTPRWVPIVLALLLPGTCARALLPAEEVPPEALAAAREGLPQFLQALPGEELSHYGFDGRAETLRAVLGAPFRLYTWDPAELLAYDEGRIAALAEIPTNHVLCPVLCDGRPRTVLTVGEIDGAWQAIAIGGPNPTPQMLELARQWPAADGYRLRYIQAYPGGSQFVLVAEEGYSGLVPLESTARSLGLLAPDATYDYPIVPPDDVAAALAPIVRAGLSE